MLPKISIIVVVRNSTDAVRRTLESLVSLRYGNKELIVIDGFSTDDTYSVVESFGEHLSYKVSEADEGLYYAMNKGIVVSTGDYLWFINAGDKPYRDDVLQVIFGMDDSVGMVSSNGLGYADIYYGDAMITSIEGVELGLRRKMLPKVLSVDSFRRGMVVCHQSFIVRRDIAPFYDTSFRYVSDIDWVMRCVSRSRVIVSTGLILCKFEEGGISTQYRRSGLNERWFIMCRRYGLFRTIVSHIGFLYDNIFCGGYRKNHVVKHRLRELPYTRGEQLG